MDIATSVLVLGAVLNVGLLIVVLIRSAGMRDLADAVRSELRTGREEARQAAKDARDDSSNAIRSLNEALRAQGGVQVEHFERLTQTLRGFADADRAAADALRVTLDERVTDLQKGNEAKLEATRGVLESVRDTIEQRLQHVREEVSSGLKTSAEACVSAVDRVRATFDERVSALQESNAREFREMRRGVTENVQLCTQALEKRVVSAGELQGLKLEAMSQQLRELTGQIQSSLEKIRTDFDARVRGMQESNERKLEEMRRTVDEKLHDTLEKRLGESFKFVSERLDQVHKGLGEMQTLAHGVGDLKRVLSNVKIRGTWAEVQLCGILDQILTAEQWSKNVCVKAGSAERVEVAIRLPGPRGESSQGMWLPIDSKFPKEDYLRLQASAESGDAPAVQAASEALLRALRVAAKDIHDKYINPPSTTDYAIMFLATEGLFAEAVRQPAFVEDIQEKYRVVIAGPSTLSAILCSLRMGFQTLVVEQRAAEVWRVLGAVKTEFGKFGGVLEKVQRQLQTASRTIEETGTRTRAMERKLRSVEQLQPSETATILSLPSVAGEVRGAVLPGTSDDAIDEDAELSVPRVSA